MSVLVGLRTCAAVIGMLSIVSGATTFGALAQTIETVSAGENVAVPASGGTYRLGAGDKLRIRFFDDASLTGDYAVQSDGRLTLPLIGNLSVDGKDIRALETTISEMLSDQIKRRVNISVELIETRPFYIVGQVMQPGAYPYIHDMTLLHALAVSGGVYRSEQTRAATSEVAQLTWTKRQTSASLARQLARLSRLVAERDDAAAVEPLPDLDRLASPDDVEKLLAAERRIFERRQNAHKERLSTFEQGEELAERELTAFERRLKLINDEEKLHRAELADVQSLADRGLTSRTNLYSKSYDLSALRKDQSTVIAEVARSERALADARADKLAYLSSRSEEMEVAIATAETAVNDMMMSIQSIDARLSEQGAEAAASAIGPAELTFKILRRNGATNQIIEATEMTRVLPGDVVRVAPANAEGLVVSSLGLDTGPLLAFVVDGDSASTAAPVKPQAAVELDTLGLASDDETNGVALASANEVGSAQQAIVTSSGTEIKGLRQPSRIMVALSTAGVGRRIVAETANAMATSVPEPAATAALVEDRAALRVLQAHLKRSGCLVGSRIDGIWGPKSKLALKQFAEAQGKTWDLENPTSDVVAVVAKAGRAVCAKPVRSATRGKKLQRV